jgi:pseudouridylate synthase
VAKLALESTILTHGVPRHAAMSLARELGEIAKGRGAEPVVFGLIDGQGASGLSEGMLGRMLELPVGGVRKLNTSVLGAAMAKGFAGATTVSTTMELAAAAGIRVFATGGLGGVHHHLEQRLDISADLAGFTRFPVAVVTSGCKSLLHVINTREVLETLGVPVVGYRTDRFPAFYLRDGGCDVDARFDEVKALARYVRHELCRTGRGVVIANPIPAEAEISVGEWERWFVMAQAKAQASVGRDVTPMLLAGLHEVSQGKTLAANLALVRSNVALGAELAVAMEG